MVYSHPIYTRVLGRRPAPTPGAEHRPDGVRRARTPAGASTRTAAPPACGPGELRGGLVTASDPAHRRRPRSARDRWAPVPPRRSTTCGSRTPVASRCALLRLRRPPVAGRPRRRRRRPAGRRSTVARRLRGRRGSSPPTISATPALSIKANVVEFARLHGVPDVARVLMLASARTGAGRSPTCSTRCRRTGATAPTAPSPAWSPRCTTPTASGTPTCCAPTTTGAAEADKTFYVSPFFDVTGRTGCGARPPVPRLSSRWRSRGTGAPRSPRPAGTARPATARAVRRALFRQPFMSLRFSALIRLQRVRLWLRRLPVVARPPHDPPAGVGSPPTSRKAGTLDDDSGASRSGGRRALPVPRPDEAHWPGLAVPPRVPVHARIAEAVVRHAVASLPVRVVLPRRPGAGYRR